LKASSLINTVFRLFPYVVNHDTLGGIGELIRFGNESDREYQPEPDNGSLSAKDYELLTLKKKLGAVVDIIGARGSGKSELAYRLAQFIDKPTFAISPEQKPHPQFIKQIKLEEVDEMVPPGSTVIYDDIPAYMSSRDYSDVLVKQLEKDIPMCRHDKARHIIFVTQSAAQADKYILDSDAVFLKPLGLLMDGIERPHVARIYKELVNPAFEGHTDKFIMTHAFMLSRSFKGLIYVKMVK